MKRNLVLLLLLTTTFQLALSGNVQASVGEDLVINEIMFNPKCVPDSKGEWFELHNNTNATIDLKGWAFMDGGSDHFSIEKELIMGPYGHLVFGRNDDYLSNGGVDIDYRYSGMNLSNSGDRIILIDKLGNIVDTVDYSQEDFPRPNGASLELKSPFFDNSKANCWAVSSRDNGIGDLCTPGQRNSCYLQEKNGPSLPYLAIRLVFGTALEDFNGWVSSLEGKGSTFTMAKRPELALFCDNKAQYYDHSKAKDLYTLLEDIGLEVSAHSEGPLTMDILEDVSLLIVTNPQLPFDDAEVEVIGRFLDKGGRMILSGQYYRYISAGFLNVISEGRGIRFTKTEIVDEVSNTGKSYYPMIETEAMELHIANCSALDASEGIGLLYCEDTSNVVGPQGNIIEAPPCVAALTGDGAILCLGSSSIITTTLYRADNYKMIKRLVEDLLQ